MTGREVLVRRHREGDEKPNIEKGAFDKAVDTVLHGQAAQKCYDKCGNDNPPPRSAAHRKSSSCEQGADYSNLDHGAQASWVGASGVAQSHK